MGQLKLMEHYGHGEIILMDQLGQNNTTQYSSPVQIPFRLDKSLVLVIWTWVLKDQY